MKVQRSSRSIGMATVAFSILLLPRGFADKSAQCLVSFFADGWCDAANNNDQCGYDHGDCCKDSCVDAELVCGVESPFVCRDPDYLDDDSDTSFSFKYSCSDDLIGNGYCDSENNNEGCGYDGGDCCHCTCTSTGKTTDSPCGGGNGYQCRDPNAVCVEDGDYVEAGTVTTVAVVANAHNGNSAVEGAHSGCQTTGCVAELTRDGDTDDAESRWSCRQDIVPYEQLCHIIFWFEEAQDVRSVEVAFWKPHMYARLLHVSTNGVGAGYIEASPVSTFNKLALHEDNVKSVTLTTSGLDADEWIHILEVRILVEVDDY